MLFGLISVFNGISTFISLFNAKAILVEEQQWHYLTYSLEDKGVQYLFRGYESESVPKGLTGIKTHLLHGHTRIILV